MTAAATRPRTFLAGAGAVMLSIVKHVPTRGALWAVIGFVFGLVADALSIVLALVFLGRGASILGFAAIVMIAIPFIGGAVFFMHGLHRGAARAALEIESKLGLVRWVVERVLAFAEERVGGVLHDAPLATVEKRLDEATKRYLASDDAREGTGITGFVLRRAKKRIAKSIGKYTLAAYRAEAGADGGGGGVSIEKVRARVTAEMSTQLAKIVMSPLNKTLAVLLILYAVIGVGWWGFILLFVELLSKLK